MELTAAQQDLTIAHCEKYRGLGAKELEKALVQFAIAHTEAITEDRAMLIEVFSRLARYSAHEAAEAAELERFELERSQEPEPELCECEIDWRCGLHRGLPTHLETRYSELDLDPRERSDYVGF